MGTQSKTKQSALSAGKRGCPSHKIVFSFATDCWMGDTWFLQQPLNVVKQNQCKTNANFTSIHKFFHSIFFSVVFFLNFNYCNSCQATAVIKTLTFNHRYGWVRHSAPNDLTSLLRLNHAQIQGCMFFHKCYFCFRFAWFGNETWEGTSQQRFSSCQVSSTKSDFSFFV